MRQHSENAGNIYGTEFGCLYEISKAPKLMKFSNVKLNHTDFTLSPFRCAKGVAVAGSFSAAGSVGKSHIACCAILYNTVKCQV